MATVLQIKAANNDNIRVQVAPGSITRFVDSDMRDVIADELRDRGCLKATTTAELATISHDNTGLVLVRNIGLFIPYDATAEIVDPDEMTFFFSADADWWWEKVLGAGDPRDGFEIDADFEYTLTDGQMLYEIWMKPATEQTVKIGLTGAGDEVMLEETIAADLWFTVSKKVFADGGDVSIFFSGFDDITQVIIYKRSI